MPKKHSSKNSTELIIPQEKFISLGLIQDSMERSEKERKRQADEIERKLRAGARIEPGKLTFDLKTKRAVTAS
jgi:hypothetical protein